jgi:hypothetical protein
MDQESLLRKILAGELHYAKLWVVCVALRGVAWDKMPFEQRELAFQAKDAASNCLAIFLNSSEYRCVKPSQDEPYLLTSYSILPQCCATLCSP